MPVEIKSSQVFSALRFAAEKHCYQRRKDTRKSPYINHPIQVAETLWRIGEVRDDDILVAALLHDTLEDTHTTPDEIESQFGPAVLSYVKEVSDDKNLPQANRKALQIATAPHKSHGAKLIKLADKLCNIYDMGHTPPSNWSFKRLADYLEWTEKVVTGLRGASPALEALYDHNLEEARKLLQAAHSAAQKD